MNAGHRLVSGFLQCNRATHLMIGSEQLWVSYYTKTFNSVGTLLNMLSDCA